MQVLRTLGKQLRLSREQLSNSLQYIRESLHPSSAGYGFETPPIGAFDCLPDLIYPPITVQILYLVVRYPVVVDVDPRAVDDTIEIHVRNVNQATVLSDLVEGVPNPRCGDYTTDGPPRQCPYGNPYLFRTSTYFSEGRAKKLYRFQLPCSVGQLFASSAARYATFGFII